MEMRRLIGPTTVADAELTAVDTDDCEAIEHRDRRDVSVPGRPRHVDARPLLEVATCRSTSR